MASLAATPDHPSTTPTSAALSPVAGAEGPGRAGDTAGSGAETETLGAESRGPAGMAPPAFQLGQSELSEPPDTTPAAAATDLRSMERMARLRQLVRTDGLEIDAAAREVGVDPIIARLWLRLPDDLWPASRTGSDRPATPLPAVAPPPPTAPASGLRRVLTCRIPAPALDRLRAGDRPVLAAAAAALDAGIALPRPEVAPGGWRFPRRPLAVPVSGSAFAAIMDLAQAAFDGDARDAAGWLIARGLGMALPLPTREELAGTFRLADAALAKPAAPSSLAGRFMLPPRRRPEPRAPLPPDDSAPSGEELRTRRDAVGISQRDLAAASGLSRGLVAEVERGRRRHVLTRLKLSETLAALERSK